MMRGSLSKSSDTDVLLLLIAFYPRLSKEVWMKAGTSKTCHYIAVHDVQYQDEVRDTLLAFHANNRMRYNKSIAWYLKEGSLEDLHAVSPCLVPLRCSTYT